MADLKIPEMTRRSTRLCSFAFVLSAACAVSPALLLAQAVAPATPPAAQTPSSTPGQTPSTPAQTEFPDAPSVTSQAHPPLEATGSTVIIDTSMGRLTCKLFEKEAPASSANFIGLAQGTKDWTDPISHDKVHGRPFYNGTTFHRVIPGFMIQGGDRLGNGMGDAGYFFDQEIVPGLTFDVPGRMAMANAGPNTNGSQFFITEAPQPDLDGKYNIFGQCDAHSVLLVASIARVERDSSDKPTAPVTMTHVYIVPEGKPLPPLPAQPVTPPAPAATPQ